MSAETLDTILALKEVAAFIILIILPTVAAFMVLSKLLDDPARSSW